MNATDTRSVVTARGLRKAYKNKVALDGADFNIPAGRIVGLIGPNGAGKTTALEAILGLVPFEGSLDVLGRDPRTQRDELMNDVCFIADVAVLPRWLRVSEAIEFVAGVHPRFDRARCERFLANTQLKPNLRVRELSKGMIVQLHLALVMAIDAKLLVLDEPTLGLDILYRKQFYQRLLEDYFDEDKTIVITTHQVEEIEHILTDVMFIRDGKIVLNHDMEHLGERFTEVMGRPPLTYLTECRMDEAEALLSDTDSSIALIAKSVGYADAFGFSAAFKRHRGVSPSVFRAALASP